MEISDSQAAIEIAKTAAEATARGFLMAGTYSLACAHFYTSCAELLLETFDAGIAQD